MLLATLSLLATNVSVIPGPTPLIGGAHRSKGGGSKVLARVRLSRQQRAFDDPDWIFELKYDGFRSLAVIKDGRAQLISRNGHPFASFADLVQAQPLYQIQN